MKVGKREHPEHILNRFFETFIIYSTGRGLQSNEGGQNDKKKTPTNMYFSLPVWLSSMLVFVFLQRGQKSP